MHRSEKYDVVLVGAGLAGLSLAEHLRLATDKRVLLLDKRANIPFDKQKEGESLVQVGGYYFAKVLDMEEYMLHEHFMKYNLRFYFPTQGAKNDQFEDYSQSYIRNFSNIGCYQLDRKTFEAELLKRNQTSPDFELVKSASQIQVLLSEDHDEPHQITFQQDGETRTVETKWVIDTTGRGRMFARKFESKKPSPIQHGAAFMWVDGLVDIEKLTDQTQTQVRMNPARRETGHLPHWLATNHFMFEGGWFWVIPLRGLTSLGLVFDRRVVDQKEVASPELLRKWVIDKFPLFERDLNQRTILEYGALKDFAHDCSETINANRWAMSGVSGRFSDPLYSPGSDFIAIHNSLIVDAIMTDNPMALQRKCKLYEIMMQSLYGSLMSTYAESYDALGDQEAFSLKYTWELSVYFAFFVYPFINDLITDEDFVPGYLSRFSRLGPINHSMHAFLSDFYQWKKLHRNASSLPRFHDFTRLQPLENAAQTFYQVGDNVEKGKQVLDGQLENLNELARFIVAYIYSVVLEEPTVLKNKSFVESIDVRNFKFDPDAMQAHYWNHADQVEEYAWQLCPDSMRAFTTTSQKSLEVSQS